MRATTIIIKKLLIHSLTTWIYNYNKNTQKNMESLQPAKKSSIIEFYAWD